MIQHLIHIGYPKSGSTFLQEWFELHDELLYQAGGLGGFRNVYEIARPSSKNYKYHVTSFEGLATPHENAGAVSLRYSGKTQEETFEEVKKNQANVCAILKSLFPDSRILIVTRGFKGMIMSSYSQSVRMGAVLHLSDMCEQLVKRLEKEESHYFDYDYLIGIYEENFGKDNVIVLPYELLRDEQTKFLLVLEEKLGLKHVEMPFKRVNPSLSPQELYWYPLISRSVAALAASLGPKAFRKIYTWYVCKTLNNKLRHLIKLLHKIQPTGQITDTDFLPETLKYCEGKAARLKEHPLYASYSKNYLNEQLSEETMFSNQPENITYVFHGLSRTDREEK